MLELKRRLQTFPGKGNALRTFASRADSLDIFIGGFMDWYTGIVSSYQQVFQQDHPQRHTCYFQHSQVDRIMATADAFYRKNPGIRINLIGHSWGAGTAARAADALSSQGIRIDKLVTIDPVCRTSKRLAPSVNTWINVNAAPASSNGLQGDTYAAVGGKWDEWPCDKAACHLKAPFHHNEFRALLEYEPPDGRSALHYLLLDP